MERALIKACMLRHSPGETAPLLPEAAFGKSLEIGGLRLQTFTFESQ